MDTSLVEGYIFLFEVLDMVGKAVSYTHLSAAVLFQHPDAIHL